LIEPGAPVSFNSSPPTDAFGSILVQVDTTPQDLFLHYTNLPLMFTFAPFVIAILASSLVLSAPTSLDDNTLLSNGQEAQNLNAAFQNLTTSDACKGKFVFGPSINQFHLIFLYRWGRWLHLRSHFAMCSRQMANQTVP
jgi:hypothetical protein